MTPPATIEQISPQPTLAHAETPERQLDLLLHTVGICPIDDIGWIRVTGADRVRWLNGMVTNSIQDLQPGEGNYSFALNAQGQIQADLNTFAAAGDSLLLQTAKDRVPAMMAMFDRFIIMDEVELDDISEARFGLSLIGPHAAGLLAQIGLPAPIPASAGMLSTTSRPWKDHGVVDLIAAYSPFVPRFELWSGQAARQALWAALTGHAADRAGGHVEAAAIEHLRVLEATPRFGIDIRDKHLAQETGQTRALHFAKGCYLGQEIVERVRSRGSLHRAFAAFRLEGPLPPLGTAITDDGKPIAELTTVAAVPLSTGTLQLALGIARREAIERGKPLAYAAEAATGIATPVAIPISISPITSQPLPRIPTS